MATLFGLDMGRMFRPTQQVTMAPGSQVQPAPGQQPTSIQQAPMAQVNPGADPSQNPALQTTPPQGASQEPPNPLDQIAQLWQTDPKAQPAPDPFAAPLFKTDAAQIQASAAKIDFLRNLPPELLAKVNAGNDPAALLQLVNAVGQQTLAAAAQLNAATTEHSHARNNQRILDALPDRIRNVQIQQGQAENPALNHPAAQPFVSMVRQQIAARNPGLTPAQVNQRAEKVLVDFATAVQVPGQEAQQQQQRQAEAGTNWDVWSGIESPTQ